MKNCKLKEEWIEIELEHSKHFPKHLQRKIAEEITCDHVKEYKDYYPNLIKMEKKLDEKKRKNI